jgi:hypothetical protein
MQRSTQFVLILVVGLVAFSLLAILVGDGIEYLSNAFSSSQGFGFGAGLVGTGEAILVTLVIAAVVGIGLLIYREHNQQRSGWG